MSLVTGSLSTIQKSNACRTSTGAGQQPQHRPQRDSGMTHKRFSFVNDKGTETGCRSTTHFKQKNQLRLTCCLFVCSKLQSFLLQQQTFLEKCETWMEFLVQTEENLAVEISGNYQSLIEQQKAHEVRVNFKVK